MRKFFIITNYQQRAGGGYLPYYGMIGCMYTNGLGAPKSYVKTFQYCKIVADKGNEIAQFKVGNCYIQGKGVDEDISLAVKYFSLSADQNDKDAIIRLPLFQEVYEPNMASK